MKSKLNFSSILSIIKCVMIGIVVTLLGVVVFAIVLKFADIPSNVVGYVNDVIKVLSIFVMVLCLKKSNEGNLLIKAIFGGLIYAVLSFIIFSILNGGMVFNLSVVYDLLFALVASVIVAIIVNLLNRKSV